MFAYRDAADNRAVGAERGASLNKSVAVFRFALDRRAGVVHIGEDHTGATKHIIFESDIVVDRDIILDLDLVADVHPVPNKDTLAEIALFANARSCADVRPVPNATSLADLRALVNDGGFVFLVAGHV